MKVFNKDMWFGGQKVVDDFAERHAVKNYCRVPDDSVLRPCAFSAGIRKAVPLSVICIGAATRTEDQGSTPKCAAFSASSYAENILWRMTGELPAQLDPHAIYARAKATDGDPGGDGTTLTAVLDALVYLGHLPASGRTRTILTPFDLKAAIHRYGTCLLGLNISDEWYRGNTRIESTTARLVGGHAVQCVGYDAFGPWIQNSWGERWGDGGFAHISWAAFNRQFMYGAFREGVFAGMQ